MQNLKDGGIFEYGGLTKVPHFLEGGSKILRSNTAYPLGQEKVITK
jgi:hypothetical protein